MLNDWSDRYEAPVEPIFSHRFWRGFFFALRLLLAACALGIAG